MSFFQLTKLRKLCLGPDLNLEELPSNMRSLTNLESLQIRDTNVHSLPPSFNKLTRIQELQAELDISVDAFGNATGWLEDLTDRQGTFQICGLFNMHSLDDAQCTDLLGKYNVEHLILEWENCREFDEEEKYNLLENQK